MSRHEYVMDVPYIRSFMDDLSPARLRLVAALNGLVPPPAEDFDYCDLGSGHGDTTVTLAAAYPRARFFGVDLNPEHVGTARESAKEGGLDNVSFVEHDFTDLAGQGLPSFDYICPHGVLSWIAPETRAALLTVAAAKLKPGGLLYVGYNALPGWAVIEPLRRLLSERAAAAEGDSRARARAAVQFARELAAAGSRYFTRNQPAMDMLATMDKSGLTYVVHEFLHDHWIPMYFADLAREMAERDLHFVGQLPAYLSSRELGVPPGVAELLKGVGDRDTYESLTGYATNQFFRRDVYVKGRQACAGASTQAYLDATPFASLAGVVARTVNLAFHSIDFVGDLFDALLPILEEGAAPLSELAARPELARYGVQRLRNALHRLVVSGQLSPLLRPTATAPPHHGPYRVPLAYNRAVFHRPFASAAPFAFASPVAGTGIVLSPLQVAALRVLTEGRQADRPDRIRALAEEAALALGGQDHAGVEPLTEASVAREVERMRREQLGKLVELGIVVPE